MNAKPALEANAEIETLISARQPGHTLPQPLYVRDDVFYRDLELLGRRWLLIDHASRIANAGDWFVVELGTDSYIVARGRDGNVQAFHNVCRHRGSRICLEPSGNSSLFVCPYHAWSYRLDGSLKSAREMNSTFQPEDHGLLEVEAHVRYGLIFLSPRGVSQGSFEADFAAFDEALAFHGIDRAKVAARRTYPTEANWKLVVENFLECYHCLPAHPEYSAVHSRAKLEALGAGPGSGDAAAVERFRPRLEEWEQLAESLGHPTVFIESGHDSLQMSQLARSPIGDADRISETSDGQPGCRRLMGSFTQSDGGQTGMTFSPVAYLLANCDFAFMITFRPLGPLSTEVDAVWLVDEGATEGDDYDVDRLMWVWDTTLVQDKTITENNQRGVSSSGYRPGPYAQSEARVDTFVRWYLRSLSGLDW